MERGRLGWRKEEAKIKEETKMKHGGKESQEKKATVKQEIKLKHEEN